jgi:hypothetical protein
MNAYWLLLSVTTRATQRKEIAQAGQLLAEYKNNKRNRDVAARRSKRWLVALTRDFKQTMVERAGRDPAFAKALLDEAATLFLTGEPEMVPELFLLPPGEGGAAAPDEGMPSG